ncbi:MAG: sensor histidine kinase, partial [Chloroflexota bacterium]
AQQAATEPGTLNLWLVAPLLAVAVQYGGWAVLGFVVSTAILEIALAVRLMAAGGPPLDATVEQEVIRAILFLTFGTIIARLIREQRRQRETLRQANEQLAQQAVQLEQLTVTRERNRMARDLHDTLAHTLSAVSIQLEAVNAVWASSPEKAQELVQGVQQVTREGLQETRLALQALRTDPVEDMGFALAVRSIAEQTAERAGFTLHSDVPTNIRGEWPTRVEQNVYRVAEEALKNVARHAEAQNVVVKLSEERKRLSLLVRDDGRGYDTTQPAEDGHYGVIGMQERADLCGGTLTINSIEGAGTEVRLTVEKST